METTERLEITFEQLVGAYLTHLLSDEVIQILSSAVVDLPPSWKRSETAKRS